MWWFFYESNSWLEDSRSSVWSGDLPKTTIYPMFGPMGISRPHFKKMNDLQHQKNNVISSFCQHWRKSPDEMRKSIIISGQWEKKKKNGPSERILTHCFLVLNRRGFFMSRAGWVDRGHSLINKNVQCRSQYYIGSDSQVLTCGLSLTMYTM